MEHVFNYLLCETNLNKVEKWADNWVEYLVSGFSNSGCTKKDVSAAATKNEDTKHVTAGWLHAYALCIMHYACESALNFWAYNIFQRRDIDALFVHQAPRYGLMEWNFTFLPFFPSPCKICTTGFTWTMNVLYCMLLSNQPWLEFKMK